MNWLALHRMVKSIRNAQFSALLMFAIWFKGTNVDQRQFGERPAKILDFQSAENTISHLLVSTKADLKPRDFTHLGKIPLVLRLRCRISFEGNKSKKKPTYRIMSKLVFLQLLAYVNRSEHGALFSRQI